MMSDPSPESTASPLSNLSGLTIDPSDAIRPIVSEKTVNFTFKGDLLEKSKGNWKEWSKTVKAHLEMSGLGVHLMDTPGHGLPPHSFTHPNT